jgi:hypothetical protein
MAERETAKIFPSMGWGLPDSPGHYLDLVSAVFGLPLLVAGLVVRAISTVAQKSQPTTKRIVTPCGLKTNRTSLKLTLIGCRWVSGDTERRRPQAGASFHRA